MAAAGLPHSSISYTSGARCRENSVPHRSPLALLYTQRMQVPLGVPFLYRYCWFLLGYQSTRYLGIFLLEKTLQPNVHLMFQG